MKTQPPDALTTLVPAAARDAVDIRDFGAVGDGEHDDTSAVQAAIDTVAEAGGGRVVVGAGITARCGSVRLRDRVELHLEAGSRLAAATDPGAFPRTCRVGALSAGDSEQAPVENGMFLWAENASDIAITGSGVIDGSARAYVLEETAEIYRMHPARPFPVFLIGCTGVVVRDVRIENAALWTLRLSGCVDVRIDNVRIANDMRVPNADGIDLDHCRRVRVTGCDIECPDDGISLKTTDEFSEYGPCESIVVSGCTVRSRSTAITVGADTEQPLRDIVVSDCVIRDSHRGISVSVGTGAGGWVENVLFDNLVIETRHDDPDWWGGGEPIVVRSAPWHEQAGAIRHVRITNVLARSENGVMIYALAPGSIEDVQISDLRLELDRWTGYPAGRHDLRPISSAAPFPGREQDINGLRPATPAAIHVENAHGVRLRDVQIHFAEAARDEFGAALELRGPHTIAWQGLSVGEAFGFRGAEGELLADATAGRLDRDGTHSGR